MSDADVIDEVHDGSDFEVEDRSGDVMGAVVGGVVEVVPADDHAAKGNTPMTGYEIMLTDPDSLTDGQRQLRTIGDAQLSSGLPSVLGIPRGKFENSGAMV